MIVGPQGPPGGGVSLLFTSLYVTSNLAPAQAKNWLLPWGLPIYPGTAITVPGHRIYPPNSGTIRALRANRLDTAGDLTFAIEVNGTQRLSLLLAGGSGAANVADLINNYAFTQTGADYLTVSLTAATPDSSVFAVFPQLVFIVD